MQACINKHHTLHVQFVLIIIYFHLQYKCDQYWPDTESKLYGNIKVTAENEVQFANYCVRRFSVEHVSLV